MKILLTGATGFIGGHLAEALVQAGFDVRALVRPSSDSALLESLNVERISGDLTTSAALKSAVKDCQYVYHLAAQRTQPGLSRKQYYETNTQGTANLAQAAAAAGVV